MKIVTIVGVRKSGKTTTAEALVRAIRARHMTVGTCKSIGCPAFTMDQAGTNTKRHLRAGANLVCARGKRETDLVYPSPLPLSEILRHYEGMDYVILEGDALAPVPRLVAGHTLEDAQERVNARTLAFVGRVAAAHPEDLTLPAFDPLTQADALLDFLERTLPDVRVSPELDKQENTEWAKKNSSFCAHCTHHADPVKVTVSGREIRLTPQQRELIVKWASDADSCLDGNGPDSSEGCPSGH